MSDIFCYLCDKHAVPGVQHDPTCPRAEIERLRAEVERLRDEARALAGRLANGC